MPNQTREEVKRIILSELPRLLESDPEIQRFILSVTRNRYADKTETENRIERLLDELKKDREARDRRWREEEEKWEAQERKWEAQERKWEEWGRRWDEEAKERIARWEAQERKWEAQERKWEEWGRRWDEEARAQSKRWEENQKTINETISAIKKLDRRIESSIGALGARWGLQAESSFRNALRAILEESFGVKVERYEDFDYEGVVFGRPDQVELDVIVYDGTIILCEIKSSMSRSDAYAFWRKKEFYEKKHVRKADRAIVVSPMVDDRAKRVAQDLGLEVYSFAEDVVVKARPEGSSMP